MIVALAQLIAIASHGNEYLQSGELVNFFPQNSTFQFCDFVDFRKKKKEVLSKEIKEIVVAENPIEWFEYLKVNNCKKIRLFHQSVEDMDHKLAGFVGGGGNWFIETIFNHHSDFWMSRWEHDSKLKDKPWKVTYGKVFETQTTINLQLNLTDIKAKLTSCLERIAYFAASKGLDNWAKVFRNSKQALSSEEPHAGYYHQDLICWDNYRLENHQLLMGASKAFVFGGMSSWNDVGFDTEEEYKRYEKLSAELYQLILESIISAINKDAIENNE